MKRPGVWEAEQGSSSSVADKTQDNLASLYRPPFAIMYHGPFEKVTCSSLFIYNLEYLFALGWGV